MSFMQQRTVEMRGFFKACLAGDIERVKELYQNDDFLNKTGSAEFSDNVTPLMAALLGNHQAVIDFILTKDNVGVVQWFLYWI